MSELFAPFDDPSAVLLARSLREHLPWQKIKFLSHAQKVDPEKIWLHVLQARRAMFRTLPLMGTGQPLRYITPDALQRELMLIDQQLAGALTSSDELQPSESQKERFIISSLREEAVASSMLEGAVTTRRQASQMLASGRAPRTTGEQMVLNNYRAIQFIRDHLKTDLSPEFLLEVQSIITEKTLDHADQVGRLRTDADKIEIVDVRSGEIVHIPPPAAELPHRLAALCAFANQPPLAKDFIHPVVAACILHFQIAFDHPFCDGNGRTARVIFYWMMLRRGYWLFEYLPLSHLIYRAPGKYVRAFLHCETDDFDVTYFLMYKASVIRKARQLLREHISEQKKEADLAHDLFDSDLQLNHRQRDVILRATRHPDQFIRIADHQHRNGISYATARSDLLQLESRKYLKKVSHGKTFEYLPAEKILRERDR